MYSFRDRGSSKVIPADQSTWKARFFVANVSFSRPWGEAGVSSLTRGDAGSNLAGSSTPRCSTLVLRGCRWVLPPRGGGGSIMTIVWETLESSKIKLERLRALSLSRVRVSYESPRWEEKKPLIFRVWGRICWYPTIPRNIFGERLAQQSHVSQPSVCSFPLIGFPFPFWTSGRMIPHSFPPKASGELTFTMSLLVQPSRQGSCQIPALPRSPFKNS